MKIIIFTSGFLTKDDDDINLFDIFSLSVCRNIFYYVNFINSEKTF